MKKKVSIIVICLIVLSLIGCGNGATYQPNRKADDAISRAVYNTVGSDKIHYRGKSEENANVLKYRYYIKGEDEDLAEEVLAAINAINTVLEQEPTEDKIVVLFTEWIPGGTEPLFILYNYTDNDDGVSTDCEKLQYLWIRGTNVGTQESIYNNPETYKDFSDIRYLRVSPKIQKAADEAGIDWYEYWSELETVEVYSW